MDQTASKLVEGIADFEDHQQWYEFSELYGPMIRKILRNKGLQPSELDDGMQEVYLSLLSTIERFQYDRTRGKFRSWLSKITQRAASAYRSRQSETPADPQALAESQPIANPLSGRDEEHVDLCLKLARSRFDERTWLAFYLRVIEEAPVKDVQRLTNMNRNAVYQSVHRVKLCLREMISQLDAPGERQVDDE